MRFHGDEVSRRSTVLHIIDNVLELALSIQLGIVGTPLGILGTPLGILLTPWGILGRNPLGIHSYKQGHNVQ